MIDSFDSHMHERQRERESGKKKKRREKKMVGGYGETLLPKYFCICGGESE